MKGKLIIDVGECHTFSHVSSTYMKKNSFSLRFQSMIGPLGNEGAQQLCQNTTCLLMPKLFRYTDIAGTLWSKATRIWMREVLLVADSKVGK